MREADRVDERLWTLGAAYLLARLVVLLLLGVAGAGLLRWGCKLVGERPPTFGRALGIMVAATGACALAREVIVVLMERATPGVRPTPPGLPVAIVVTPLVYWRMVPTSYGKALLIWLLQAAVFGGIFLIVRAVVVPGT